MIDLRTYKELKTKNAISVVKAGDAYAVTYTKFNENTGENLPDEVRSINMQELTDRKTVLQEEIVEIDAFIADCNKLI